MLGIAIGVALLFASQVANTSLDGSVQRLTHGIVGQMRFQVAARDSAGFDERLLNEIAKVPGVQAAAPVLERNANVVGPSGQRSVDLVGTDPRLARLGGSIAQHVDNQLIGGARVIALPAPLAQRIGVYSIRSVTLQIGAGAIRTLLVPQLLESGAGALGESPIALAPLRTVQRMSGMQGRLTSIYVRSAPRLDRSVRGGAAAPGRRAAERASGGLHDTPVPPRGGPCRPVDGAVLCAQRARRLPLRLQRIDAHRAPAQEPDRGSAPRRLHARDDRGGSDARRARARRNRFCARPRARRGAVGGAFQLQVRAICRSHFRSAANGS